MRRIFLKTTSAGPEGTFLGERPYRVPDQMPAGLADQFVDAGAAYWMEREKVEAATEAPAPENAAERTLPPWTLKTSPADYLDQYGDDAPNSELARRHLEG